MPHFQQIVLSLCVIHLLFVTITISSLWVCDQRHPEVQSILFVHYYLLCHISLVLFSSIFMIWVSPEPGLFFSRSFKFSEKFNQAAQEDLIQVDHEFQEQLILSLRCCVICT